MLDKKIKIHILINYICAKHFYTMSEIGMLLNSKFVSNAEIYRITGISTLILSQLSLISTTRLTTAEFYFIAINTEPCVALKENFIGLKL